MPWTPEATVGPPTAAAVPKSAVSTLAGGLVGRSLPARLNSKPGVPSVLQKVKPVPAPQGARERSGFIEGAAHPSWGGGITILLPGGPENPPMRCSCPSSPSTPFALQKYIAQVLQDSEVDGDGDGAPGSSGDEPPLSSSQDEELLMPPDGLTDTDFQSYEDSLIENEIHQ